jgi:predicted ArsR family transcriptional regulator
LLLDVHLVVFSFFNKSQFEKSREKIISLLTETNSLSATAIADLIGITPKAVEKHFSKLKSEGVLRRVGPDKGGHWEVV